MSEELKEFRALLDMKRDWKAGRGVPPPPEDEDAIIRCIQVMLNKQCIYGDMHGIGPSYQVLSTPEYQGFFRRYFAAMGLEFFHDTRSGMVALKVPGYRLGGRLKKDETSVVLALRLGYEEAFRRNEFDSHGRIQTTTDELYEQLEAIAGVRIEGGRLRAILEMLERKGVVRLGDRDPVDHVYPLTIMPGIEVVVPETYVERLLAIGEKLPKEGDVSGLGGQSTKARAGVTETAPLSIDDDDIDEILGPREDDEVAGQSH